MSDAYKQTKKSQPALELSELSLLSLMDRGGFLIQDFIKGINFCRFIHRGKVKIFPMRIVKHLYRRKLIDIHFIDTGHCIYKLFNKKTDTK